MDTKTDTTVTPLKRFLVALPIFDETSHRDQGTSSNEPDESLPWLTCTGDSVSTQTSQETRWVRSLTTATSSGNPTSLRSWAGLWVFGRSISRLAVRA